MDQMDDTEVPKDWACTWAVYKLEYGPVTLHNDDPQRPLPFRRYWDYSNG